MPIRRVYATEADDAIATELNAIKVDTAALRTKLLAIAAALDADVLTKNDYVTITTAALTSVTTAELIRASSARGTELGGATDLDGKKVYSSRADGAEIAQHNASRTDLAGLNAGLTALLGNLDADGTVDTDTYEDDHAQTMTSNPVVKVSEAPAGEPAQLNAAGSRMHASDADDGLGVEVESLGVNATSIRSGIIGTLQTLDDDAGVPLDTYEALYTPDAMTGFGVRRASGATVAGIVGSLGPVVSTNV